MGQSSSSLGDLDKVLVSASAGTLAKSADMYRKRLRGEEAKLGGSELSIEGGCDSCGGTAEGGEEAILGGGDLQSYGNTVYSKKKEDIIRDIAVTVFKALRVAGAGNAKTAPIDKVVAHLAKIVPNVKKGEHFSSALNKSGSHQKRICDELADAINKHYGNKMIDVDAEPGVKCRQVAEVMHTLLTGMETEFMTVAGDVLRTLKNMQLLNQYIDASYKKQQELLSKSGDSGLKEQSEHVAEFYKRLKGELERQMAMVSNMLNVSIDPTSKTLIGLLEDNKEFVGMIRDLKLDLGTDTFGQQLTNLLYGVSSVAHAAHMINKALKTLGMSVGEFKAAKNKLDLRLRVFDHIQKSKPNSRELDKMMAAANIIYKHDYDHHKIAAALGKSGAGESGDEFGMSTRPDNVADEDDTVDEDDSVDVDGGDEYGTDFATFEGGADEDEDDGLPAYFSQKSLSRKIKNKQKYRQMMFKDFRKVLKGHYRDLAQAANRLASAIGHSVPVNDDLDQFIKVFKTLPSMNEENLHVALSGYAKDVSSRNKRDDFLSAYKLVVVAAEPLTRGPGGELVRGVVNAINSMIKTVDGFADTMVKPLTEIHVDTPEKIADKVRGIASGVFTGSGEDDLDSGFVEFDKVRDEMDYRYSIGNIKSNLAITGKETSHFGKDYEQLLGEEAGWMINSIRREFNALIENSDPSRDLPAGATATPTYTSLRAAVQAGGQQAQQATRAYQALRTLWTRQRDAKVRLVEVAQAVDLYLKAFSDGLAKDPDSIKSVVKMLDQVDIVAKWFNERSGDNLTTLFDFFPSGIGANYSWSRGDPTDGVSVGGSYDDGNNKFHSVGSAHYYSELQSRRAANNNYPGNPSLGSPLLGENSNRRVEELLKQTDRTVKSMRALENILSCFRSVGSKLGGLDPQSKTFMNPGQIFNALCEYLSASAVTTEFAPDNQDVSKLKYASQTREQRVALGGGATSNIPVANIASMRVSDTEFSQNYSRQSNSRALNMAPSTVGESNRAFGVLTGTGNGLSRNASVAMSGLPDVSALPSDKWQYSDTAQSGSRTDLFGWRDFFYDTDMLFVMVMKSVVAKVFTMVDAYRLFHRPTVDRISSNYQVSSLHPLRVIMGGREPIVSKSVKIIPEAVELYFRLPLLAEWYREIFGMRPSGSRDNESADVANQGFEPLINNRRWRLSIVPSIDGVWSGFVNLIFDKYEYVAEGNYTENTVQEMVREMNKIYEAYRNKGKYSVRDVLNAFVVEMNRVFGFIQQSEIDQYLENKRANLDTQEYSGESPEDDYLDYDILDAEDQFGRSTAPSDRFVQTELRTRQRRERVAFRMQQQIEQLRRRMDVSFRLVRDSNPTSFVTSLRNYKKEISSAGSDVDKYNTVLKMIQGANRLINVSSDKLIMLHEAVVAPLHTLYSVTNVLQKLNSFLHGTSLRNLADYNNARTTAGGNISMALNSKIDFIQSYSEWLRTRYNMDRTNLCNDFAFNACSLGVFALNESNQHTGYVGQFVDNNVDAGARMTTANVGNNYNHQRCELVDNQGVSVIIRDTILALMDIASNPTKLVQYNISSTGDINVNYSGLQNACLGMLSTVKSNINKLRIEFEDSQWFDRFTANDVTGSTHWLDENLVEVLFRNRDRTGLDSAFNECMRTTFQMVANRANFFPTVVGGEPRPIDSVVDALAELVYYPHYGDNINYNGSHNRPTLLHNDLTTFPFNVLPILVDRDLRDREQTSALQWLKGLSTLDDNANINWNNARNVAAGDLPTMVNQLVEVPVIAAMTKDRANGWQFDTLNSIVMRFNDIVWNYLRDGLDNGSLKIHPMMFEEFMNGPAAYEIIQNRGLHDIVAANNAVTMATQNVRGAANAAAGPHQGRIIALPAQGSVLRASLAATIRALNNTIDPKFKKRRFAYDSTLEMPAYMKDRLRTNLPYYSKLFEMVIYRADILRRLIANVGLGNNMNYTTRGAIAFPAAGRFTQLQGASWGTTDRPTNETQLYFVEGLNHLVELANSIKRCCDNTYKEMQDTGSYFMELDKDFIANYKKTNGVLPVMPVSNVLLPQLGYTATPAEWNNPTSDQYRMLLPNGNNGSHSYRFNRAARLLLARSDIEPQIDHVPGAKDIYNKYAVLANRSSTIGPSEYAGCVKGFVVLTRFLNDGLYSRLFATRSPLITPPVGFRCAPAAAGAGPFNAGDAGTVGDNFLSRTYWDTSIYSAMRSWQCDRLIHANIMGSLSNGANTNYIVNLANELARRPVPRTNAGQELSLTDIRNMYTDGVGKNNYPLLTATEDGTFPVQRSSILANGSLNAIFKAVQHGGNFATGGTVAHIANGQHTGVLVDAYNRMAPYPYQLRDANSANLLFSLAEAPNHDSAKVEFATFVNPGGNTQPRIAGGRQQLRVANIIDMNIVPINVHAFMREVPFVNLLNYSYTFDRMVHDFVLPRFLTNRGDTLNENNVLIQASDRVRSTRELMVKLLTHPYADLSNDPFQYFGLVASLFNGNDDLRLGRPRYLSDQLWHKALLTSSAQLVARQPVGLGGHVSSQSMSSLEGGPQAYEAQRSAIQYVRRQTGTTNNVHGADVRFEGVLHRFAETGTQGDNANELVVEQFELLDGGNAIVPVTTARAADNATALTNIIAGVTDVRGANIQPFMQRIRGVLTRIQRLAQRDMSGAEADALRRSMAVSLLHARGDFTDVSDANSAAVNNEIIAAAGGGVPQFTALTQYADSLSPSVRNNLNALQRLASINNTLLDNIADEYLQQSDQYAGSDFINNLRFGTNFLAVAGCVGAFRNRGLADPGTNIRTAMGVPDCMARLYDTDRTNISGIPLQSRGSYDAANLTTWANGDELEAAGCAFSANTNQILINMVNGNWANVNGRNTLENLEDRARRLTTSGASVYGVFVAPLVGPNNMPFAGVPGADGSPILDVSPTGGSHLPGFFGQPLGANRQSPPVQVGAAPPANGTFAAIVHRCCPARAVNFGGVAVSDWGSMSVEEKALGGPSGGGDPGTMDAQLQMCLYTNAILAIVPGYSRFLRSWFSGLAYIVGHGGTPYAIARYCRDTQSVLPSLSILDQVLFTAVLMNVENIIGNMAGNIQWGTILDAASATGGASANNTAENGYNVFLHVLCQMVPLTAGSLVHYLINALSGARANESNFDLQADPVQTTGLKVFDPRTRTWSVANGTPMAPGDVLYLAELGRVRFDTKLTRNLTWMVQLQRIMRQVMVNHLQWIDTPVVRGMKIADPKITEYEGNDQFDPSDFRLANYGDMI